MLGFGALTSPVTSENNMMPRDHQSAAWLYGPPPNTSGAVEETEKTTCGSKSLPEWWEITTTQKSIWYIIHLGFHQKTRGSNIYSASQVCPIHNWVNWTQWEENTGGALMLPQYSEQIQQHTVLYSNFLLRRKQQQILTHVLDCAANRERSSSSFEPPREPEIRQPEMTWIRTNTKTNGCLHKCKYLFTFTFIFTYLFIY